MENTTSDTEMTYVDPNMSDTDNAAYCADLTVWLNANANGEWLVRPPRQGEISNDGFRHIDGPDCDDALLVSALENA